MVREPLLKICWNIELFDCRFLESRVPVVDIIFLWRALQRGSKPLDTIGSILNGYLAVVNILVDLCAEHDVVDHELSVISLVLLSKHLDLTQAEYRV